jgi:membrane fusion protein, copper/silver efflux system
MSHPERCRSLPVTLLLAAALVASLAGCGRQGAPPPAAGAAAASTAASSGAPSGRQQSAGGRRVLFYRNAMDPSVTSPVPAKDAMGMAYVPVYADEAAAPPAAGAPSGLAAIAVSPEGLRLAGAETRAAAFGVVARSTRTPGIVVPDETRVQHVHTKISGWVETLAVNFTGQLVRRGQPLLTLYSPELLASQEEYLRARAAAARFAESTLPEVRRGGEELVTAARRRLELFDVPPSFLGELDRSGRPRRSVPLLAPAGGYVTAKQIFAGQQVDPAMELFTLTDLARVWVEADFYEYEAQAVKIGQQATLDLPYTPGVRLAGRIAYVYPTLAPESRTLKVRIEVANRGLVLKPGMYVDVTVPLEARSGVVIPDSAVIDSGLRQVVFVEAGSGRFEPREVRIGLRSGGQALVAAGVAAGERVVTRANFLLDSESQLRAAIGTAVGPPAAPPAAPPGGRRP